jgi:hypothetical protein
MAEERKKRVVIVNEDEPKAGNYAYKFYDNTHPIRGDAEEIARMRKSLRGLRGEEVTMVFKGQHIDSKNNKKRFTVRRTFTLNSYSDAFGPGSAYASAIHYIRDKHSDDQLNVMNFSIEEADSGDEDSEYDEE